MKYKVSGAIAIPKASWGCAPALPNRFRVVSLEAIFRTFHVKHCKQRAAGEIKSFSVQQFFKNAAEVWASSPHLRSKLKLHRETKQKSKRKSEESQLPLKSKGCNEIQGFRGNCDSQASWGCAPALPNRIQVVSLEAI
jgi:hypothetical protein